MPSSWSASYECTPEKIPARIHVHHRFPSQKTDSMSIFPAIFMVPRLFPARGLFPTLMIKEHDRWPCETWIVNVIQ